MNYHCLKHFGALIMKSQLKSFISSAFIAVVMLSAWTSCTQEPKNVTIYKNAFTVTFDANGGTGSMQSQTFPQDVEQALTKNGFTAPSGRVFGGWTDDCDSTDVVYSDNQFIKVEQNKTLYALWIAKEGDGTGSETKGWPNVADSFKSYTFNGYRDTTIYPGDDFYNYSLGGWVKAPNQVGVWRTTELGQAVAKDDKGINGNQESLSKYIKKQFAENIVKTAANNSIIKKINEHFEYYR